MSQDKPAIIFITADQLRRDALSCYGCRAIATPHLDALAGQGVRFNKAYANSPWCLPSRTTMLTGLYPHNHQAYSNFRDCQISAEVPNMYQLMRQGGYCVHHIGKCHYAPVPYNQTRADSTLPYEEFRDYYVSLGIDHLDLQDDKQVSVWYMDDYARELQAAGYLEAYRSAVWNKQYGKVFAFPGPAEWHPDAWVGRKAVAAIENSPPDQPFFAWVSFSGPHFPFDTPNEYLNRVDEAHLGEGVYSEGEFASPERIHHLGFNFRRGIEGAGAAGRPCKDHPPEYWHELRLRYFANVALIDDMVGAVLSAAKRRFGDNTLVIFTADHGEMLGNHRLWGKHSCGYEDVLNVPLLVKYPDQTDGAVTDAQAMLIDLLPTMLSVAGVEPPPMDGRTLQATIEQGGYPYVLAEGEGFVCISDGATKLVRLHRGDQRLLELIDLEKDPLEFRSVAGDPAYSAKQAGLELALVDTFLRRLLP